MITLGFENITAAATSDLEEPALNHHATARVWETGKILDLMNIGVKSNDAGGIENISSTSAYTEDGLDLMM